MQKISLLSALWKTKRYAALTPQRQAELRRERLRALVRWARENSPYYREAYRDVPEAFRLSDLPPTDKLGLMARFDDWVTDREVTLSKVRSFMEHPENVGEKLLGRYLVYTTSGSTGNPAVVLYDQTAMNAASAVGVLRSFARKEDMKAFLAKGGRSMGLFADGGFYLGTGSIRYNLKRMPWKKRQLATCDVRGPMPQIVSRLNAFQPAMLGSYPTALELLMEEQRSGRLQIAPVIIMAGGEYLSDDVRRELGQAFQCYVQTNYSCTEGGTLACECIHKHFHINQDWTILEAVDENGRPVPDGVQSAKVLLTNLSNFIQPYIRYELNDRVVMHHEPCPCGNPAPWLTLEGRTDEILDFPGGVRIPPLALYAVLKEVPGVRRFQLIQRADASLELRLSAQAKQEAFHAASAALTSYLAGRGVQGVSIALSMEEPRADGLSGKFRHIFKLR